MNGGTEEKRTSQVNECENKKCNTVLACEFKELCIQVKVGFNPLPD
jgi:hypothetical protein